jgi:crotonobetainyl-CoA:carnitine CoA-transferase CaiB-like acyl-CoA transferase
VVLDLSNGEDLRGFEELLANADILIENTDPGSPEAARLDAAGLRLHHPALVILSVSAFGATGRYSGWQATDPVLHALSGELSRSGIPDRAPVLPPGKLGLDCAAAQGAYVLLLAYYNRLKTGQGDHLDFSLLDAVSQALDPGYGIAGSAAAGVPASELPRGRSEGRHLYPIFPCADGFVRICVLAARQWQGMFEWLGRPEEFSDPSFNTLQVRFGSPTLVPAIARLFAGKTATELEAEGQRYGIPISTVLDLPSALESDQVRDRKVFIPVEIAPGVEIPLPHGMIEIDGRRAGVTGPPPRPGEHQRAVSARPAAGAVAHAAPVGGDRPLAGLRVLDLGVIVVGAETGRLLGDQGADVVKVESAAYPDGSRQAKAGTVSVPFAAGHRNKRAMGINLRDPEGRALFLKLAERADIILSNFKPGTMESLGLDYATVSAVNPGVIMTDNSAFGPTGPWSRRMGYGPLVRASTGLTYEWCYEGEPFSFSDAITVYPDHVAARIGVIGVLSLLIRRMRTGRGGTVSVAQSEVMLNHMAPQVAALALTGQGKALEGGPPHDAPWGVFPCAGDDEWCVVTVRGDADWAALCRVMGRADLAADPALSGAAGRHARRGQVDQAVAEWLAVRDSRQAMEELQAAGVPGAMMLRVSEMTEFPHFHERQFFALTKHPYIAQPFYLENAPVRSERMPDPPMGPAPGMGEHTTEVMREWLALPPEEITRLLKAKVLEMPDAPGGA